MKTIRFATAHDMEQIHSIYAWYVENSRATFAYQAPSLMEMKVQWESIHRDYPYLVCEQDDKIIGYAYAHRFKEKEAYQWDVELTIYVHLEYQGNKVGLHLMGKLLEILQKQGIRNAYSCITVPNDASIALHERLGFKTIGIFQKTGYKQGKWLDVAWLEKCLCEEDTPMPWKPIEQMKEI